jgi:hypothetical protein
MRNENQDRDGTEGGREVPAHLLPVIERLKAVPPVRVSHDLAPEILARVKASERVGTPPSILWRWVYPLAAAAALVVLLGGLWALSLRRPGPRLAAEEGDRTPAGRAVDWLCRTQEPDGSWSTARWGGSKTFEVALTGLSLMAVLGDRETSSGSRRVAVDRAADYLVRLQDEHGEFGAAFDSAPYNQGIATLALLHVYRERKSEPLRQAVSRALAAICARQHHDGGWGYRQEASPASNLSITLWQIEALRLAASLGWPDLRAPIERGSRWIAGVADEDGTFGYRQKRDFPEGSPTLTAMGAMSVLEAAKGIPIPPARRQAIKAQMERLAAAPVETLDYYRRYFLAAALAKLDEEGARQRLAALRGELAGRQVRQGPDAGSWLADDRWSSAGGRIYATSMASLSLR